MRMRFYSAKFACGCPSKTWEYCVGYEPPTDVFELAREEAIRVNGYVANSEFPPDEKCKGGKICEKDREPVAADPYKFGIHQHRRR